MFYREMHIIFFILIAEAVYCQKTETGFQKVEGLNSNVVYSVMQDSKGYLWVGTEAGASRYDGYGFTHYTIEEGLADNDVFQIKEDSKGRLWFLTFSGKPSIYENGHILNASNTSWLRDIQPKKLAKFFLEDKVNSIWFVTLDTAYHIVNDKVTEKYAPPQLAQSDHDIQHLTIYKDTLYLVCNEGVYNTVTNQLFYFTSSKTINQNSIPIIETDEKIFYVIKNNVYDFSLQTHANNIIYKLPEGDFFIEMFPGKYPDTVYISTVDHLYKLNTKTKQCTEAGISMTNAVTHICKDSEGNLWVSSLTKGLFMKEVVTNKKLFKINASGLPENIACYSFSKVENDLYIGYDNGYYITKKGDEAFTHKLKDNKYMGKVQQIFRLQGKLYSSFNHGIITQLGSDNILSSLAAKDIVVSNPFLYVARSSGILKIGILLQPRATIHYIETVISGQRASKLLLFSKDSLFAGGFIGLQLFVNGKKVTPLPWKNTIINASISKIIKTADHQIVFSTENKGLGIIFKDSIYTLSKHNGLLSNSIIKICSSRPGLIWLVTTKGINKLTYRIGADKSLSYSIENYNWILDRDNQTINDILQSNDTLYLATGKGAFYHTLTQKPSGYIPKLYINSVIINDSSYTTTQLQHLSFKENKLRINFVGLAFQANGKIKYRYKLEGTDTIWQETLNTFVEYPYLIPGHYLFVVTAALPDGSWNPHPATVAFSIQNPFWKTWWFITAEITGGLLIISLIAFYFIHAVRKKNQLIKERLELDKQVTSLEQKALHLQMNPHFIFNAINAIKGFYVSNDKQAANAYIDKFAAFMRLLLEKSTSSVILLEEEINMLDMYLNLAALRQDAGFIYTITVDENINPAQIVLPVMLIQPFAENAVIHGIAPLLSGGKIDLYFSLKEGFLSCVIEDNGVGRKRSKEINKRNLYKSKGIAITEQRLHLLSKQSSIVITDKTDEQQNATGTIVTITLPIQLIS